MTTLHLTRGLPASGKTTWAREWLAGDSTRRRVNRDDLRAMLFDAPTYSWDQEQQVTELQRATVRTLLRAGHHVVCDDTHLRPKYIREWDRFARANGADIEVHDFPINLEEAVRRDLARERNVGGAVIRRMAERFLRKGEFLPVELGSPDAPPAEAYVAPKSRPYAVIVDIDGTVAHKAPGRDIYDLSRVRDDTPHWPVIEAVRAARRTGMQIVFCSGRDESSRSATEDWLAAHVYRTPSEPLFMRAEGDRRRDSIVKRELFDANIRHEYDVRYVLDDRNQVVEMWRSLGLTCFQVAEGDF